MFVRAALIECPVMIFAYVTLYQNQHHDVPGMLGMQRRFRIVATPKHAPPLFFS